MLRPSLAALLAFTLASSVHADDKTPAQSPAKPALTVTAVQPQSATLPLRIEAHGNVAAWQEASIGTESSGLRLADVRVNVGEVVKRGQVLAVFSPAIVQADFMEAKASLAQAEATLAEAVANAKRSRELEAKGFISAQKVTEAVTAETAARARVDAQRAVLQNRQLRVDQTRVLAPDNGVISARSATVGAVLPAGQELFRLIRQGRLEWRAEVAAAELAKLKPGIPATVTPDGGPAIKGMVRMVAPTVDPQTRNGLVYVDLPTSGTAKAGMFARGEFEVGLANALTLPQSAVILRDGFSYVMRIGPDAKLTQTKVAVGRRSGDRIEIIGGLEPSARIVASGSAFLTDGDTVRVLETAPAK